MYWIILLQQAFAATTHIVARGAATSGEPIVIVFVRGVLATITFGIAVWLTRSKSLPLSVQNFHHWWKFVKPDLPRLLVLGALNMLGNQLLFVTGLKYTVPPNAALAYALTPTFVLVISVVWFAERATTKKLMGIGLAFVGVLMVLFEKGIVLGQDVMYGNMIELTAAFSWALYSVLGRSLTRKYGALRCVTLTMVTGMVLYVPFLVVMMLWGNVPFLLGEISLTLWLQIVYLALIATCLSFFLWFYVLGKTEASKVAVFSNLQPILTTVFSILLFGEASVPSLMFVVGSGIVIVGVLLTQW